MNIGSYSLLNKAVPNTPDLLYAIGQNSNTSQPILIYAYKWKDSIGANTNVWNTYTSPSNFKLTRNSVICSFFSKDNRYFYSATSTALYQYDASKNVNPIINLTQNYLPLTKTYPITAYGYQGQYPTNKNNFAVSSKGFFYHFNIKNTFYIYLNILDLNLNKYYSYNLNKSLTSDINGNLSLGAAAHLSLYLNDREDTLYITYPSGTIGSGFGSNYTEILAFDLNNNNGLPTFSPSFSSSRDLNITDPTYLMGKAYYANDLIYCITQFNSKIIRVIPVSGINLGTSYDITTLKIGNYDFTKKSIGDNSSYLYLLAGASPSYISYYPLSTNSTTTASSSYKLNPNNAQFGQYDYSTQINILPTNDYIYSYIFNDDYSSFQFAYDVFNIKTPSTTEIINTDPLPKVNYPVLQQLIFTGTIPQSCSNLSLNYNPYTYSLTAIWTGSTYTGYSENTYKSSFGYKLQLISPIQTLTTFTQSTTAIFNNLIPGNIYKVKLNSQNGVGSSPTLYQYFNTYVLPMQISITI